MTGHIKRRIAAIITALVVAFSMTAVVSAAKVTVPDVSIKKIEPWSVNAVRVIWYKNSQFKGYKLYRATSRTGKYYRIATFSADHKATYVDKGLTGGKVYYYKMKAYKTVNGKTYYSRVSAVKAMRLDKFYWPVPGYKIKSSAYGWRIHPITGERQFHEGIDVPCPKNTPIKAALSGTVTFAKDDGIYGNKVVIESKRGIVTKYCHNTSFKVKKGQKVKRGETIALAGTTGRSTGYHCHFEVWVYGKRHNPNTFYNW